MEYILEHFGVSVGAVTGALAARGKQVDLFGVLVLALVTALGGGTVRDVMLGALPIFWTADQSYVINVAVTAVVTFYLVRYHELPNAVLMVADAFVLALFTMMGTRKGLAFHVAPLIAVIMGVTTGVAGGILRDLLIGEIPLVFRREIYLYATAAFCGATGFALLHQYYPDGSQWNPVAAIAITLFMRLAGIRWKMTLPLFRPKNETSAGLEQPSGASTARSISSRH
jgi:uncharacterized membrane protein YeiH